MKRSKPASRLSILPASAVTAKGYGGTKGINKCADGVNCPEKQHQMNRRTEFTILELK